MRRWPTRLAMRIVRRFEWFPFTLLAALLLAAVRRRELRSGRAVVRLGRAADGNAPLPLRAMLWLDHIGADLPSASFNVCVRLPPEGADATLHDVFSVLLTSPRLTSIGVYWDDAALSDDLPLWQPGAVASTASTASSGGDTIDAPTAERLDRFLREQHQPLDLPVAARREAQTLLKRLAGSAEAICLNLPDGEAPLFEALVTARPDARFFDLGVARSTTLPANVTSLAGYGLTLHERLALVQAADAYVGRFDELGAAAIISGRPTQLVGRE